MFELNKKLETEVEIKGQVYSVNMAFDNIMNFIEIVDNIHLHDLEKIHLGLKQLLGAIPELSTDELVKVFNGIITNFIHGDKKEVAVDLEGNPMPIKVEKPIQDLKLDAPYIFVSFKQAYGIDLIAEQGKLDWRLFKIYLRELPEETRMKQIMGIRSQKLPSGKSMAKERERISKLKRIYALPEDE